MKIPVKNNTAMTIYVGATAILPGETRHFEEDEVPHHLRPAQPEEEAPAAKNDPLAELLKGGVKDVVAALNGMLLTDIERLGVLEQQGQARKGILGVIADIQLKAGAQADTLAKVAALSDEELAVALEDAKTDINVDPDYLAALEAEAAKRNPESVE